MEKNDAEISSKTRNSGLCTKYFFIF